MRRPLRAFLTGLLCLCTCGTAWAQFDQYTTPGGPAARPEDAKGRLAREVEQARYHLGSLRIAPWLGWQDVAYVKSLVATGRPRPADFTATVGAGLRLYLPGGKTTWTAYALPEYVWWQKEKEQRRLNERIGGGFHGFWNRLTLEVTGGRDEAQRLLTPDLPRLVNTRGDHGSVAAEIQATRRFSLFATGTVSRSESLADPGDPDAALFETLDRKEEVGRAGLRWRPRTGIVLSVGAERSEVRFLHKGGALDRSNAGTAPIFLALYEHNRLLLNLDLAARSLKAIEGSSFVPYNRVTGQAALSYRAGGAEVFLYSNRNVVYSIVPQYPYLEAERTGLSLHVHAGHRTAGSVYAEAGQDGYVAARPEFARRRDDVTSVGGTLQFELGHGASAVLSAVRSRFVSNLPGNDRSFTSVGLTVSLTGSPAP